MITLNKKKILTGIGLLLLFGWCLGLTRGNKTNGGIVSFSPPPGKYSGSVEISLSSTPLVMFNGLKVTPFIFYTINGSEPRVGSKVYQNPIQLTEPGVYLVQAVASNKNGNLKGSVFKQIYTVTGEYSKSKNSRESRQKQTVKQEVRPEQKIEKRSEPNIPGQKQTPLSSDTYSRIFDGKSYVSELLLDKMGEHVIKLCHPLSIYRENELHGIRSTSNGGKVIEFKSTYRSFSRSNEMLWSITFSRHHIPVDINFIRDSGKIKTGRGINYIKDSFLRFFKQDFSRTFKKFM